MDLGRCVATELHRIGEQVLQRVQALVAGPVGQGEGPLVEHRDKAGRVAARRGVDPAFGVRRGDHQEGRGGDEVAAVPVELAQNLAFDQVARLAVAGSQILGFHDDVGSLSQFFARR